MILAMKYIKLAALGTWLLVVIWFEDTSDWSRERILLARRTFAVVMTILVICSIVFTVKAIGQELQQNYERRIDRIEARQDTSFLEHSEMKQRLAVVESISTRNDAALERLIWGVIGLTIAAIGQLLVALLRFKLDRDNRVILSK